MFILYFIIALVFVVVVHSQFNIVAMSNVCIQRTSAMLFRGLFWWNVLIDKHRDEAIKKNIRCIDFLLLLVVVRCSYRGGSRCSPTTGVECGRFRARRE